MPFDLHSPSRPLIYLITRGKTTDQTTPATEDFSSVLRLVQSAVDARIDLLQIREKRLTGSVLYQLATSAAGITRGTATKLLINDRADIAAATGADGVHLTTTSIPTAVVRQTFGGSFLIGVSTHSLEEASRARSGGADFIVFGPVFDTKSKEQGGEPAGLTSLARVCAELAPFPVFALGGVTVENVAECVRAGACGVAAIRMLQQPDHLADIADIIRLNFAKDEAQDATNKK